MCFILVTRNKIDCEQIWNSAKQIKLTAWPFFRLLLRYEYFIYILLCEVVFYQQVSRKLHYKLQLKNSILNKPLYYVI